MANSDIEDCGACSSKENGGGCNSLSVECGEGNISVIKQLKLLLVKVAVEEDQWVCRSESGVILVAAPSRPRQN